jgi:hypothetical protein
MQQALNNNGNHMTADWNHPFYRAIVLMLVIGVFCGCASVFQDLDDQINRSRFKTDHQALEAALAFFEQGDYHRSLDRFKTLAVTSKSGRIVRRAKLGEICCRLVLADTHAEFTTAVALWHEFTDTVKSETPTWDLVLFDPVIGRLATSPPAQIIVHLPPAAHSPDDKKTTQAQPPEIKPSGDPQAKAAFDKLKAKAKRAEQLQQQLEAITAENRSLKKKIKALETIDQNIQKKKTEISAPGE